MISSIRTTHVGSLPRSKELSKLLFAKDKKENFNQKTFNQIVQQNVEKVVKRQLKAGIDFISDVKTHGYGTLPECGTGKRRKPGITKGKNTFQKGLAVQPALFA